MNAAEMARVVETYRTWRGAALQPREIADFTLYFSTQQADLVERSIKEAAVANGWVNLAAVAQKHARLVDEALTQRAAEEAQKRRRQEPAVDPRHPGWPVLEGNPTGAYLGFAIIGQIYGAPVFGAAADRYVKGGYVLEEHLQEVVAAMSGVPEGGKGTLERRFRAGDHAIKAIEGRLGAWASAPAKKYVEEMRRRRERASAERPRTESEAREPGEEG